MRKLKVFFIVFTFVALGFIWVLLINYTNALQGQLKEKEVVKTLQENIKTLQSVNDGLQNENNAIKVKVESLIKKLTPTPTPLPTSVPTPTPKEVKVEPGKVAYLTFDDGPSKNTDKILDILKKYKVKATFFVIGNTTENGKREYQKIINDGHTIGNHTFSHDYNQIYQSVESFKKDFKKQEALLHDTIGIEPKIMRFPGGSNNHVSWHAGGKGVMKLIADAMVQDGYQYFDWNVDSTDASKVVQERSIIVTSVLSEAKDKKKAIVLMHDAAPKTTTVEALPEIIEGLQAQGFSFDTLHPDSFTYQFLKP
jgi:peptidoglycan/xylan/chitin deacetylase (PgdA/CDA1 family)